MTFVSTALFAQEKELHLILGGNTGLTNFSYKLETGTPKSDLGFGAFIEAQYYFDQYFGFSIGLDFSIFNTNSYFKDKKFLFPGSKDNEKDSCDITVQLRDWTERQKTYFLDIPLLLKLQYKWGEKEKHGFYFGLGIKLQIPVSSNYEKTNRDITVYGHYPALGFPAGKEGYGVELSWYGEETNDDLFWSGENQLKTGCGIIGEIGFLIGLSRRVDMMIGVSADYGFVNIKKNSDDLLEVEKDRMTRDDKLGKIVSYNGILNSKKTNMIYPLSVKANLGLRIKIGKLGKRNNQKIQTKKPTEISNNIESRPVRKDTIIVNPIIVPIYLPLTSEDDQKEIEQRPINYNESPKTGKEKSMSQTVIDEIEESIYFVQHKYDLDQKAMEVLDRKVAQMKRHPSIRISMIGHTCEPGSGTQNDELAHNRVLSARYYMIGKGITPHRIEVVPRSKHHPFFPNSTDEYRRLDRRVDFIFRE